MPLKPLSHEGPVSFGISTKRELSHLLLTGCRGMCVGKSKCYEKNTMFDVLDKRRRVGMKIHTTAQTVTLDFEFHAFEFITLKFIIKILFYYS